MRGVLLSILVLGACSPEQLGCEPRVGAEGPEAEGEHELVVELPPVVQRGDGNAIEYTLRVPRPETHYVEVDAIYPAEGESLDLLMAVWTPGSYLVREYARHIEDVRAMTPDEQPLQVDKTAKNRWQVTGEGELPAQVMVRYRVYARELSVRTSFVDADVGVFNPAATVLTRADRRDLVHSLKIERPDSWSECVTAMPEQDGSYLAADYDELVDSPVVCGTPHIDAVEVNGVRHELASFGGGRVWDDARALADVESIVEAQHRFWRVVPYSRYVFLNLLFGGGGGLEHRASTMVMGSRWESRDDDDYRGWLGLISHEFFHTWNVKRLRPTELDEFDYESENYFRTLWVVEGITSYYDDLMVRRAGLMERADYLAVLARGIGRLQETPGREVQPLSLASFDAWIKFYRPDENTRNSAVSYYGKGSLVAWLLDATIRQATTDKSLDDVMRLAYERYSGERGYTPDEFRAVASEVAGTDLDGFFDDYVDGTAELDWSVALRTFGLRFKAVEESEEHAYLGVNTENEDGRIVVSGVPRGSPAFEAGINVEDELIAIDGERLPHDFAERIARYRPGDEVEVTIARRGRLRALNVTLGIRPEERYELEVDPNATPIQRRNYQAWLGPESATDD